MPYATAEKRRAARKISYRARKDRIVSKEKEYKAANPEAFESRKLKNRYGITLEQFNSMREKQGNRCAICGDPFKATKVRRAIHVDHCHETLKVRGLLCSRCNVGIGLLADSVERLKIAIAYLSRSKE